MRPPDVPLRVLIASLSFLVLKVDCIKHVSRQITRLNRTPITLAPPGINKTTISDDSTDSSASVDLRTAMLFLAVIIILLAIGILARKRKSIDDDSEEEDEEAPSEGCWHHLPTAWIHFIWVELFHVYVAAFAWMSIVYGVPSLVYMSKHHIDVSPIKSYFAELYTLGSAHEVANVTFNDNEPLTLPQATVNGAGIGWLILVWAMPLCAFMLVAYALICLALSRQWSFESGAYLHFTWHLAKKPVYKWLIGAMAVNPILLLVVWFVDAHLFESRKDLAVDFDIMKRSLVSLLLLLFSLDRLAFPTTPVHHWGRDEMCKLRFRRSFLHLVLGSNSSFGMKFTDALWMAQFEDTLTKQSRICKYFKTINEAEEAIKLCKEMQEQEIQGRIKRDGAN